MTYPAQRLAYTLHEEGLRWEVLSHVELPGGAITWLRVLPAAEDLASAMLLKDLVIQETGVVARLRVQNTHRTPVLLQTDLVVDGGKQARVIERSVIVPAFATAEVPVRCVEAGRWHPQSEETATSFSNQTSATVGSREFFAKMKKRAYQTNEDYSLDQGEVWNHVASELKRTRSYSTTQSYTAFLSQRATRLAEARKLDIQPPPCANGLALVRPDGGIWIESFPTRDAMGSMVPSVVADVIEDSVKTKAVKPQDAMELADTAMMDVEASPLVPLPPEPSTLGQCFALNGRSVAGHVLIYNGRVAHLVASVEL